MSEKKEIEMIITGLVVDKETSFPVIILSSLDSKIQLPIWIGKLEATSIVYLLKEMKVDRPLTIDLLYNLLLNSDSTIERVYISKLEESTFYSEIYAVKGDQVEVFDARPSDAIAIALKFNCPIYVNQQVIEKVKNNYSSKGFSKPKDVSLKDSLKHNVDFNEVDKDKWDELLANLTEKDFKNKM